VRRGSTTHSLNPARRDSSSDYCNLMYEFIVFNQKDFAHPARAEFSQDAVMR
jgi:hypothetical protein